jgi:hypothetical protein
MPSCNEPCRAKWLAVADNLLYRATGNRFVGYSDIAVELG